MTNNKSKHKDVARIDQPSKKTYGWYVRVRYLGKTHSKFFSDKKCGSKSKSLLAAVAWRDATEKAIGKPRTDRHMVTQTQTRSNTGEVGVRLNEKLNRYEVSWVNKDGKQGKTSVSINAHGKYGAFKRACEIRAQKEAERIGTV